MDNQSHQDHAIELLQQLGLKEYEAKSFVALVRLPRGTAKEISEISDVPRTRVYDAVRVLESKGLVEVQHSNPQRFRAVSIDEAIETLHREYEDRTESLRESLRDLDPPREAAESEVTHETWALSGETAIGNRTESLIEGADEEIVMVIGNADVFTAELADALDAARGRGVSVVLGAISEDLQATIQDRLPDSEVFVSELAWLSRSALPEDDTEISRLLLVDREAILVSSVHVTGGGEQTHEKGVFGRGFHNGLVAITRRILATGLLASRDPETEGAVPKPSGDG